MVYINENSGTISIPRHTFNTTGLYRLIVSSNISNEVILVEDGNDISTNTLYYKFALGNLDKLNVGEYTYNLYFINGISTDIIETGLLTYGNFNRVVTVNNTFNKEKIQYNG